MSTQVQLMTADELLALPRGEFRYELVNGELKKMSPAGHNHGKVIIQLTVPIAQHVRESNLGAIYAAETGFQISWNPDTVLAPDIAFVRRQRVEQVTETSGYFPGPPDLAVEVLSPSDRVGEVEEKVAKWLLAGTEQVWVVSPKSRTVLVHRSATDIVVLTEKDTLEGGEVLRGFRLPIAEIFE